MSDFLSKQLEDLLLDVQLSSASADNIKTIVEFVETEIDKEAWGIELSMNQWAVLKAYYQLPLTIEEESFLESLKLSEYPRTTWDKNNPTTYQYLVLEVGRRGSKSSLCSIIVCYEFYKLCHLPNPQKHYGVASNTPISMLLLATTAEQAQGTIYAQVSGLFKVVNYFKVLISKKLIKIGADEISYPSKQLGIISGNSRASSQVGYSIILLVMDEFARIEGTTGEGEDEELSALTMWSNLGASGISFNKDAKRIAMSSAWYEGDAIENLYQTAEVNPTYLGFRLCTWQLNPRFDRDNPVIDADYIKDPRKAALEFEGIRSGLITGFFETSEVVHCFRGENAVDAKPESPECPSKIIINRVSAYHGSSYGYLDPAVQRDSYAFAFGHKETDETGKYLIFIDGIIAWKPTPKHKVSIVHVQETIEKVHSSRRIVQLGVDQHNSAETAERLTAKGIPVQVYAASNKMQVAQYTCARELMHDNRLILPRSSHWRSLLQDEMCRVLMIKESKIDHPRSGSKDLADAVAGVCWLLMNKPNYNNYAPQVTGQSLLGSQAKFVTTSSPITGFRQSYNQLFNRY